MILSINLKVKCLENEYSWEGEYATFEVKIESPELIDAIDLNAIKKVLVEKAVEKQVRAELEKKPEG